MLAPLGVIHQRALDPPARLLSCARGGLSWRSLAWRPQRFACDRFGDIPITRDQAPALLGEASSPERPNRVCIRK